LPLRHLVIAAGLAAAAFSASAAMAATGWATADVNMRSCGGTRCAKILTIPAGSALQVESCDSWCRVVFAGRRGYVSARYVRVAAAEPAPPVIYYGYDDYYYDDYYYDVPNYWRFDHRWRPPHRAQRPHRPHRPGGDHHSGPRPGHDGPPHHKPPHHKPPQGKPPHGKPPHIGGPPQHKPPQMRPPRRQSAERPPRQDRGARIGGRHFSPGGSSGGGRCAVPGACR
jgi:uncharacterized protein YraI